MFINPPAHNKTPEDVKTALTRTIAGLEKFRGRGYTMLINKPPSIPAGDYPATLKRINPMQPPERLGTYLLLVTARSTGPDKLRLHRQIGPGQNIRKNILTLVKNNQILKLAEPKDKITLARWCYEKEISVKRAAGFAQIYPVSSEQAEKAHLFDYQYTPTGLRMTPKENLLAAERESWGAELEEFGRTTFEENRANVEQLRHAGWALSPVPFSPLEGHKEILDVNQAIINLHKTREELMRALERTRLTGRGVERSGP